MGVTTPDIVQDELKSLHDTYGSWRVVQKKKHPTIPFGTLSTIAKHGKVPKKWYHYFGIREYRPAPVCLKCGQVHVTKRCTANHAKHRNLFSWPVKDLRKALEHREEML